MNNAECIYNFIKDEYGNRGAWISDIATKLGITKEQANILTLTFGYARGKIVNPCTLESFGNDENVRVVLSNISDDKIKDLSETGISIM